MISPINNVVHPQPEPTAPPAASRQTPPQAKAQPPVTDTVQLSSGVKAVVQETLETPAQTAKEASAGDAQAKRLLAKETHH